VVTICVFHIITKIFSINITIITAIGKKPVMYYLWGVFSVYGFTTRITG
jgi:hypothetical protein